MVDINLIGDDQAQFEGEENENEKEFQESYESDLNEPTPSSFIGGSSIDDSDYTRMISRGGSKKLVYILAACGIILIAAVAWFMFQPGKGKKTASYEPPMPTVTETETKTFEDSSSNFNLAPEPSLIPASTLAPALREKIIRSNRGISTVNNVLNSIPSNVNFTLISYSDGKFLVEFLAASDADINQVNSQLQQSLYAANVNLLSKEDRTIQNRRLRHALVNGNVNINQATDESNPQEPTYLNATDLQNQLSNMCRQAGLTIKQFDTGREKTEGEFMILPIKFKATGQKSNIFTFLQQLVSSNINIGFSKISLIAKEIDLSNPDFTLLLNIGLYRMI
jgi:hypothetical protein